MLKVKILFISILFVISSYANGTKTDIKNNEYSTNEEFLLVGKRYFNKKKFFDAKIIFKHLISTNSHQAESNFYLGEIEYFNNQYKDALFYFHKSLERDDDNHFLQKLLLHSALSYEKLGDIYNRDILFEKLIDFYPLSHEAKEVKQSFLIMQENSTNQTKPIMPVITLAMTTDDKFIIKWSSEDNNNIVAYNIYKTSKKNWFFSNEIKLSNIRSLIFEDKDIKRGIAYEYRIQSIDINGIVSEMTSPVILILPIK
ncbi:hypothetical protein OAR97_02580 [Arcobacteraceae bacterium]|nr:hypothetical protein [Arcobacteraceae bacterium]